MKAAVYGTLRQGDCRGGVMDGCELLYTGRLPYFKMVSLGGFPAVDHATMHDEITVEIYEIDEELQGVLDGIEGFPNFYNRSLVPTPAGDAWIYYIAGCTAEDSGYPPVESGDWFEFTGQEAVA